MDVVLFSLKRAFRKSIDAGLVLTTPFGLTPARFDLIRVIEMHAEGLPQRNIHYLLGVSAPTVCRMLKSLEALGFVKRRRFDSDRRCVWVELTEVGRYVVADARDRLVDSGLAERFALRGLGLDPEAARPDLTTLQNFLARMRKAYGDWPLFTHPWRIGCIDEPYAFHDLVDGRLTLVDAPH
jgi:DNA-binding MarR family transcriptional regulator